MQGPSTASTASTPDRAVGAVLRTVATAEGTVGGMPVRAGQGIAVWAAEGHLQGVEYCSGYQLQTAGSWVPCGDCNSGQHQFVNIGSEIPEANLPFQ